MAIVDPMLRSQLLAQAVANAKALAVANRSQVPMNNPPQTLGTNKADPLGVATQDPVAAGNFADAMFAQDPQGYAANSPFAYRAPPAPQVHPFQNVPLSEGDKPPPQPLGTEDQNVINPDEGLPQAPKQQEASLPADTQIQPASDSGPTSTPAAAVFDASTGSLAGEAKRFFDNPASTDALLAFGGAMLTAPSFNQGLGQAAIAVGKALDPYKMPSDAELARANLKQKQALELIREKGKYDVQATPRDTVGGYQDFYDENNKHWSRSFINGKPVFTDDSGNVGSPQGAVRSSDSQVAANSRVFSKDNMEQVKGIESGQQRRQQIDQAIAEYDHSGAGPGVLNSLTRMVVDATGMDFNGVKVTNYQELTQLLQRSNLLEAQGQRGLGQLTEGERELIAKAWPQMSTNREAFMNVMNTLKASIDRREAMYSEWTNETGGNGSFRAYYVRRMKELNDADKAKQQSQGGTNRPSLNSIFGN